MDLKIAVQMVGGNLRKKAPQGSTGIGTCFLKKAGGRQCPERPHPTRPWPEFVRRR